MGRGGEISAPRKQPIRGLKEFVETCTQVPCLCADVCVSVRMYSRAMCVIYGYVYTCTHVYMYIRKLVDMDVLVYTYTLVPWGDLESLPQHAGTWYAITLYVYVYVHVHVPTRGQEEFAETCTQILLACMPCTLLQALHTQYIYIYICIYMYIFIHTYTQTNT